MNAHRHEELGLVHAHAHGDTGEHQGASAHQHPSGLRGVLHEIFRPHSHDAADSMDSALEATQRGVRAVKISFAALLVTSLIQVVIVVFTGSVALAADTIHNFSDALTAIPLFLAFRLSHRPPNRRYTYGYRRAEDLAGLFVVGMIALSSIVAAVEALDRLLHPRPISGIGVLFVAGVVGFAGNELVALFRIREGNAIGSAALVADGYHARTDGFTSLAVAAGAVAVGAGFERADPVVGIAISIAIFAVLRGAAKQMYYRLMDAVDPDLVDRVENVAAGTSGVRGVDSVRARWLGHRLAVDLTIRIDGMLSVSEGHAIADAVHRDLLARVAHLDDVNVHVDPETDATVDG